MLSQKNFYLTNLARVAEIDSTIGVAFVADLALPQVTSGADFGVTRVTLTGVTSLCVGAGMLAGLLGGAFVHI